MRHIALEALQQAPFRQGTHSPRLAPAVPAGSAMAADVSIRGPVGFVLLVHRWRSGEVAEEIYYSVRGDDGQWQEADHISGGVLGIDIQSASDISDALRGEPMLVISESESMIYTGRSPADDGYEVVRFLELLIADSVGLIQVDNLAEHGSSPHTTEKGVNSPLNLLVLMPGERVRLHAARKDGSSTTTIGQAITANNPAVSP